MNNKIKTLIIFFISFMSYSLMAQNEEVPMADGLRAEGKIYVVVAILLTILLGLISYVFFTDRKISALEKKIAAKKS
jgi:hypothetical protein